MPRISPMIDSELDHRFNVAKAKAGESSKNRFAAKLIKMGLEQLEQNEQTVKKAENPGVIFTESNKKTFESLRKHNGYDSETNQFRLYCFPLLFTPVLYFSVWKMLNGFLNT